MNYGATFNCQFMKVLQNYHKSNGSELNFLSVSLCFKSDLTSEILSVVRYNRKSVL